MRTPIALLMILTMAAAMLPAAHAQSPTAFDLVVEDPEEDAVNHVATGVHVQCVPPENPTGQSCVTQLSTAKQDIVALSFATTADTLYVKLNTLATYAGTSSLLYTVFFTVGETSYFTCWNVQSAGLTTNYQDVNENFDLGCSRFSLGGTNTQVGPATRDGGVVVGPDEGDIHILWPVARADIGDPADGVALTNVYAATWNRGVNTDHAPSTSPQSGYVWNQADRAPDEGAVAYPLGGFSPAALPVDVAADATNRTVGPGSGLVFVVDAALEGNATGNLSIQVSHAPAGWDTSVLGGTGANATSAEIEVAVPEDAVNGTYNVTVEALVEGNVSAALNLTVVVDEALPPTHDRSDEGSDVDPTVDNGPAPAGNATGNETAGPAEGGGIPGPALVLVLAAAAVAVLARRRR